MFAEWVAKGAAFGIEAFFAIFTFGLFALAAAGLLALAGKIMGGNDEKQDRRPY